MTKSTIALLRAATAIIAPAVLLASFIYHPHVGNPIDADFLENLAAAVLADPTRWAIAHLMAAIGSLLIMLAFLAVRGYLREAGEHRWSPVGLPLVIIGSTFYALLPAIELGPMAAAQTGADVAAMQGALMPWFRPILLTGATFFGIGAATFAVGIARSGIVTRRLAWIVAPALVVMAAARFAPINIIQFYVQGAAGIIALWPLAYVMWWQSATHSFNVTEPISATSPATETDIEGAGGTSQVTH